MNKMKYFIIFIVMQVSVQAFACSCLGIDSISEATIAGYSIIFKGEVLTVENKQHDKIIRFKIEKLYKGEWKADTISIHTSLSQTSCGLSVSVGQTWLLYAKGGVEQEFWTSMCFRSLTTDKAGSFYYDPERMKKDLQFLEKRKR